MQPETGSINKTSSSITFDESTFNIKSRKLIGEPEVPTMIKILVKSKIVRGEKQAMASIAVFTIILILFSIFFIKKSISIPPAIINPEFISN